MPILRHMSEYGTAALTLPARRQVDAQTRAGLKMLRWQNAVIIFDEAHNTEARPNLIFVRGRASACNR